MKLKSPKQKGTRLELDFRDMLIDYELDKQARRTPLSGALEGWKSDITTKLPFAIECKNTERLKPREFYEQAVRGINLGSGKKPVVVMKSNRTPIFVMMNADDWCQLVWHALQGGYADR